jgi:hypothetical protein
MKEEDCQFTVGKTLRSCGFNVAWKLNKDFSSSELQEIFGNVWIQNFPFGSTG